MFKREHHQKIHKMLNLLNVEVLNKHSIYFGGGTACALLLNEYRESVDVDFLVDSIENYSALRAMASNNSLGEIVLGEFNYAREIKADRYGIRTFVEIDGTPIRVEFVLEARIKLSGEINPITGVPTLCRNDLMAEKLLANDDRGLDPATFNRDIIDLSYMIQAWGNIPKEVWSKVNAAYGKSVVTKYNNAIDMINVDGRLLSCMKSLVIPASDAPNILNSLNKIGDAILDKTDNSGYAP